MKSTQYGEMYVFLMVTLRSNSFEVHISSTAMLLLPLLAMFMFQNYVV